MINIMKPNMELKTEFMILMSFKQTSKSQYIKAKALGFLC